MLILIICCDLWRWFSAVGMVFFFFNDTATTEIYTRSIVGSVRCVQETDAEYMGYKMEDIERGKGIEDLIKRKEELQKRFNISSNKLKERIGKINKSLFLNPTIEQSNVLVMSSDSVITMPELLNISKRETGKLLAYAEEISANSSKIWGPIKSIEKVKMKIESSLDKARSLAELRSETELLKQCFERQEYEAAAEIIERQRNVQEICVIDKEETKDFEIKRDECIASIEKEYEIALRNRVTAQSQRLAGILCKMQCEKYASEKYLSQLKDDLKVKLDAISREASTKKKKEISASDQQFISTLLGKLFGTLLDFAEQYFPIIKSIFSDAVGEECMKIIETFSDSYGGAIIQCHMDRVTDSKVMSTINNRELLKQKTFDTYPLFVKVDYICEENAAFSSQFQSFRTTYFELFSKYFADLLKLKELRVQDMFDGVSRKIYELIAQYLILENFFLQESISRHMSTEYDRQNELAKSFFKKAETLRGGDFTQTVDDIFYLIEKCLSLIHISEPTRPLYISYAVFCLKKKKKKKTKTTHQENNKILEPCKSNDNTSKKKQ
eukprot:TRINITY_DN7212_c0_g1_i2.p1 TRINITY_DN7212_c0_g1~~TRINITY_DN7212_c0_g1_i2.p1  ORF type:complete len:555 (-),score=133.33 TRINITY_DN7212_c0_g1_i2:49-1713(-)